MDLRPRFPSIYKVIDELLTVVYYLYLIKQKKNEYLPEDLELFWLIAFSHFLLLTTDSSIRHLNFIQESFL